MRCRGFGALLVGAAILGAGCQGQGRTFRVGYMTCNAPEETRSRFEPLTAYLSEATGARFEPVYLDTGDVEDAFARGDFEFTHTNSPLYLVLKALLAERFEIGHSTLEVECDGGVCAGNACSLLLPASVNAL